MELKRCVRCGCFFCSDSEVCCNCASKDKKDVFTLNNYIVNSRSGESIDDLSIATGVSIKNINRFVENDLINNV